jgi:hypothetical protein
MHRGDDEGERGLGAASRTVQDGADAGGTKPPVHRPHVQAG